MRDIIDELTETLDADVSDGVKSIIREALEEIRELRSKRQSLDILLTMAMEERNPSIQHKEQGLQLTYPIGTELYSMFGNKVSVFTVEAATITVKATEGIAVEYHLSFENSRAACGSVWLGDIGRTHFTTKQALLESL